MRQTDYTQTTATEKLAEYNDDAMQVIRAYLSDGKTRPSISPKLSTNQQIYKEIRGMMDDAAINYKVKQEAEQAQQAAEQAQQAAEQAQQAAEQAAEQAQQVAQQAS